MKKAFLAKLGWRILTCGEEAWCKLLRAKYGFVDDGLAVFKLRQRSSNMWQGIIWSSYLLHSGLRWKVNNGIRARFLVDKWLDDFTLL